MKAEAPGAFRSAGISVSQTFASGILLFALYRFLLREIGPAAIGIWAIVLATTAASRLSDMGLAASVVRFVAKYRTLGDAAAVNSLIQTAAVSIAALLAIALLVGYPLFLVLLNHVLPESARQQGRQLVPYALGAFWLSAQASVYQSALDGFQRFDLRNLTSLSGNFLYLVLSFLFVPRFGLLGLGYVQVTQSFILALGCWLLLRHVSPSLPIVPRKWSKIRFREMVSYGVNFQIIGFTNILFDLTTKSLLSRFGSLSDVAYFDMASRMVMQLRGLIVSANQVMVPYIAVMYERQATALRDVYERSYQLLLWLGIGVFGTLLSLVPLVSVVWIGRAESTFIFFAVVLSIGWGVNVLSGPAYFANLGTGHLYWNTLGHLTIAILNVLLGYALGSQFGSLGVVSALVLSVIAGSSIIVFAYQRENHISQKVLVQRSSIYLAALAALAVAASWSVFRTFYNTLSLAGVAILSLLILLVSIAPAIWLHPLRAQFLARLKTG